MFRLNLGDEVIYRGEKLYLANGPARPKWLLRSGDTTVEGNWEEYWAHESDFKKIRSFRNYWHDFTSGYRFYMLNWYGQWVQGGIKDWQTNCRIWPWSR